MAQMTFKAMPKATSLDAADMPHILGDPADAAWEGVAERANSNFATFNTWAPTLTSACHASDVSSGAAVFAVYPQVTLKYAYARNLPLGGGMKLVTIDIRLHYTTDILWGSPDGSLNPVDFGVFSSALRFTGLGPATMPVTGFTYSTNSVGPVYTECVAIMNAAGVLTLNKFASPPTNYVDNDFAFHLMYPLGKSP